MGHPVYGNRHLHRTETPVEWTKQTRFRSMSLIVRTYRTSYNTACRFWTVSKFIRISDSALAEGQWRPSPCPSAKCQPSASIIKDNNQRSSSSGPLGNVKPLLLSQLLHPVKVLFQLYEASYYYTTTNKFPSDHVRFEPIKTPFIANRGRDPFIATVAMDPDNVRAFLPSSTRGAKKVRGSLGQRKFFRIFHIREVVGPAPGKPPSTYANRITMAGWVDQGCSYFSSNLQKVVVVFDQCFRPASGARSSSDKFSLTSQHNSIYYWRPIIQEPVSLFKETTFPSAAKRFEQSHLSTSIRSKILGQLRFTAITVLFKLLILLLMLEYLKQNYYYVIFAAIFMLPGIGDCTIAYREKIRSEWLLLLKGGILLCKNYYNTVELISTVVDRAIPSARAGL